MILTTMRTLIHQASQRALLTTSATDLGARAPALDNFFPNSFEAGTCAPLCNEILTSKGFSPDTSLFATSVCPDEINADCPEYDISNTMERHWGEQFPLGGLAGLPFAGKTGWGAFAAHVPVGGDIVLLFAPHCGISFEGNAGSVQRLGQPKPSTCCGAAVAAFNHVSGGNAVTVDPYDMQQSFLNETTERRLEEVKALSVEKGDVMVGMTHMLYDEMQVYLRNIINMGFGGRLAVIGGVQINLSGKKFELILSLCILLTTLLQYRLLSVQYLLILSDIIYTFDIHLTLISIFNIVYFLFNILFRATS
jgi:hypothetical protein